jgi:hypothetical protein
MVIGNTSTIGLDDGGGASHEGGDEGGGRTHGDSKSAMVERR